MQLSCETEQEAKAISSQTLLRAWSWMQPPAGHSACPPEEISALQLLPHQLNSLVAVAALTSAMTRTGSSHSRAWPPLDVVGFEGICSAQVLRHLQVPHCPVSELRKESGRRGG